MRPYRPGVDAARGEELLVLRGHEDSVRGVAWSPNGQCLATASHDRTARIWGRRAR
ncbi:MAG: WD40 repeat domain-containing protein [Egibacteraceae bacterium]